MTAQPHADEIETRVWAFESALAAGGCPDLTTFLPDCDSPNYLAVLRELACVELERIETLEHRTVAHYLARFPQLASDPEAVETLSRQEARTRAVEPCSIGHTSVTNWREKVAELYEGYKNLAEGERTAVVEDLAQDFAKDSLVSDFGGPNSPPVRIGELILGFRLIRELGRGSFGHVFLAEETELAARRVVLKIGTRLFDESTRLAQLQHSHIVPIYSTKSLKELQVICMPYLGETTLSDVLALLRRGGGVNNAVWSTLVGRRAPTVLNQPASVVQSSPDRRPTLALLESLRTMSHDRSVLWVGAKLADALAHAHERGVLHRDIKPENVLIADDGTPLLLDFNLSAYVRGRTGHADLLGGTLPYMSPEHLAAFRGGTIPVDEHSDIFSLGVLLFELLTGQQPYPVRTGPRSELLPIMIADRTNGPPRVRALNRQVTPAVDAILARCLEPDPSRRYPTARALHDDLQRQLDDYPLLHTREPSSRERARKFIRRNSRGLAITMTGLLAIALLAAGALYIRQSARSERAEIAEARSSAINTFAAFQTEAREAKLLLGLPSNNDAIAGEKLCRSALVRFGLPDRVDWENSPAFANLPSDQQLVVRQRIPELLLLTTRAIRVQAVCSQDPTIRTTKLREALQFNEHAEQLGGVEFQRPLTLQRALLFKLAGLDAEAEQALAASQMLPVVPGSDHWLEVGELIARGEIFAAEKLLVEATNANPSDAASWATLGACMTQASRHSDAIACYSTVLALAPEFSQARVWRAAAYIAIGEVARAKADLDVVLGGTPDHTPALLLSGIANLHLREFADAELDLTRVLEREPNNTRVHFIRARVRMARGDTAGAAADRKDGLQKDPGDELSWITRGVARQTTDPKAALADFDEALRINPNSREAAQNKAATLSEFLGKTQEAVKVLDSLLDRFPKFVEARIGRGVLLARLGNRVAAHADVAQALQLDQSAPTLYRAGCVYALTTKNHATDADAAFRYLTAALLANCTEDVSHDDDLSALRANPMEFTRLLNLAAKTTSAK